MNYGRYGNSSGRGKGGPREDQLFCLKIKHLKFEKNCLKKITDIPHAIYKMDGVCWSRTIACLFSALHL